MIIPKKLIMAIFFGICLSPNLFADDLDSSRAMTPEQRIAAIERWQPKTDAEKWQKEGLIKENQGDWKGVAYAYKQMLEQPIKDKTVLAGTHVALRRAYFEIGDAENEQLELKWISDNVLSDAGEYHFMLSYLQPDTILVLQSRSQNYPLDNMSKLIQLTKKNAADSGDRLNVKQSGNFAFVGPTYYEKGKAPISVLERKIYDEYMKELETTKDASGGYDDNKKNAVAQNLINKYKMSPEDFTSLVLKVAYNEVTPGIYHPPRIPGNSRDT